jgi:hypothetical protein
VIAEGVGNDGKQKRETRNNLVSLLIISALADKIF